MASETPPDIAAPATIEAVSTACEIVDLLAESAGPVGVQQVASNLCLTKSRASRHLANLEALGVVMRSGKRGFRLGGRVIRWGHGASRRSGLTDVLAATLEALNDAVGHTVLLCASTGAEVVVLRSLSARSPIRIEVEPGLVLGLPHSPSACVALAFQPRERRRQVLAEVGEQDGEGEALVQRIARIQRDHYCWIRNRNDLGRSAIAAPVFGADEALACVVTIMLPLQAAEADGPPPAIVATLLASCERCSRLLGSRMRFPEVGQAA